MRPSLSFAIVGVVNYIRQPYAIGCKFDCLHSILIQKIPIYALAANYPDQESQRDHPFLGILR